MIQLELDNSACQNCPYGRNMPQSPESSNLESLLKSIRESAKYRHVAPDLILRLGAIELQKRRNLKEAIKETKNTLHQVAGAYLDSLPPYSKWLIELEGLKSESSNLDEALHRMMASHTSTRERIPLLEEFYRRTVAEIGELHSVLDLACGLNPLALSFMPLVPEAPYFAYDLYLDMMSYLNSFFQLCFPSGMAEARDVVANPPTQGAHIALILKFLPVLEQTEKDKTLTWLKSIQTEYLLISFPTKTLTGRTMRMAENYEAQFREVLSQPNWSYRRLLFDNELCFLIEKKD